MDTITVSSLLLRKGQSLTLLMQYLTLLSKRLEEEFMDLRRIFGRERVGKNEMRGKRNERNKMIRRLVNARAEEWREQRFG